MEQPQPSSNSPLIVLEFMEKGSVLSYLRSEKLSEDQLVSMCYQTAKGMEYLESRSIFHCDLAARNLLVSLAKNSKDIVVKISDLGMGKIGTTSSYYAKDSRFPVRWAAPEIIQYLKYSCKSDVWAFGNLNFCKLTSM